MRKVLLFNCLLIIVMILSGCGQTTPSPTLTSTISAPIQPTATQPMPAQLTPTSEPTPEENVLYLNLTWHQHQPLYYKNEEGIYTRPWVRVHSTKDYYDMAEVVSRYPDIHVTFNLTPVLIRQIDDFVQNGAKDVYWVLSEKPAGELTEEDRRFILERFFDANWDNIIARFPRYEELLQKRGGSDITAIEQALGNFSEQDFRDLQIWFNLAWFDPDFLAVEPLRALVDQGRDFSEDDKEILFNEVREVLAAVIPLHRTLQEQGQIQVITTPYAHPILPLITNSNLASVGNPSAELPPRFAYPNDTVAHLERSIEIYNAHFGQDPVGLWPGEGAVAQDIVPFVARAGYKFMQTGEPVLAKSLNIDISRDNNETVVQANELYRPYYVQDKEGNQIAVFFRDGVLSDKLGFTYSQTPGEEAAADLMQRLEFIRTRLLEQGATGPNIVSIILDGENAWEYYPNDGKEFFEAMYRMLSESNTIKTMTPSEYLELFPEQHTLENLFPGAWFSPNYDTWIGENEEKIAWEYLGKVRKDLGKYDIEKIRQADPEKIAEALDYMYLAEGSDWFWWYGSDQDSGVDSYFDTGFRALLAKVYEALGDPVPTFVNVPIIQPNPVTASQPLQGVSSPQIDGRVGENEWTSAAAYLVDGKIPSQGFWYTVDTKNLYFRVDITDSLPATERIGFYMSVPKPAAIYPFSRVEGEEPEVLLGVNASHLVEWSGGEGLQTYLATESGWEPGDQVGEVVSGPKAIEFSVPLTIFEELNIGDDLRVVTLLQPANQFLPEGGPAQVIVPDLGLTTMIIEVSDPKGDDYGPGTYSYPTDPVFEPGSYDIQSFTVASDETNVIFKFTFYGPVSNSWGSPNGLAIQTLDVYIDQDPGNGSGARLLLPGRNAAFTEQFSWDFALWAEGWTPQVLIPDAANPSPKQVTDANFKVIVDPAAQSVTLRIPREVLGKGDPTQWAYAGVVLSQEGFPSTGVWRVRDIQTQSAQWKFGGGTSNTNQTRIIDFAWQAESSPSQEEMLSTYSPSMVSVAELTPDDFPQLEMIISQ